MPFFDSKRFYFMILGTFLTVLTFIFFCVGLAGSSNEDEDSVIACNWAYLEYSVNGEDYTACYGTRMSVTADEDGKATGGNNKYKDCDTDICSECEEGGNNAIAFLCLAWLLTFPLLIVTALRVTTSRETNSAKGAGVIISALMLLFIIISMGAFGECFDEIADADDDVEYGPAFNCLGVSILTTLIILVLHLLTPVSKEKSSNDGAESNQA